MSLATMLTALAVTALAELPDKSMLASLVLGTRFRPLYVWVGVAAALAVHVVFAVSAGSLLTLLPETLVETLVVLLFAGAAVLLWRGAGAPEPADANAHASAHADANADAAGRRAETGAGRDQRMTAWRVTLTAFGVGFVGEWGDITQITTANLAARSGDPASVAAGAVLGLWTVAALATLAGQTLLRAVPERLVRRTGAAVLGALAALSLVQLLPF